MPAAADEDEVAEDSQALGIILNRMEDSLYPRVIGKIMAKAAWDVLKAYDQMMKSSACEIKHRFYSIKMTDSTDVQKHIQAVQDLYFQLQNAGVAVTDDDLVDAYILLLPDSPRWFALCSALEQSARASNTKLTSEVVEQEMMEVAARSGAPSTAHAAFQKKKVKENVDSLSSSSSSSSSIDGI
ncbi:hypothetical protein HK405_007423, partial [Cladochytrium tenue]